MFFCCCISFLCDIISAYLPNLLYWLIGMVQWVKNVSFNFTFVLFFLAITFCISFWDGFVHRREIRKHSWNENPTNRWIVGHVWNDIPEGMFQKIFISLIFKNNFLNAFKISFGLEQYNLLVLFKTSWYFSDIRIPQLALNDFKIDKSLRK